MAMCRYAVAAKQARWLDPEGSIMVARRDSISWERFMGFLGKFSPQLLGITRIVIGLLFLEHGTAKVLNFPHAAEAAPRVFDIMAWPAGPAGIIELVAGAMIVLGFFSRWAAFIASGEMAFAYFMAHAARSPYPLLNGGGEAICFCFIFLYLAAAGPGSFAINRK
jgi:putative oxidoreductase